jgi:integrase
MINKKIKLTERSVAALGSAEKEYLVFDTEIAGFACRVSPKGRKSFCIQYRNEGGRSRRFKIGRGFHPEIKVEWARREAKQKLGEAAGGQDPSSDRREKRKAPTVQDLHDDYFELHAPKKRESSLRHDRANWANHLLPRFGSRKVRDVTRSDIEALHGALSEHPYQANRVLALASKALALAVAWGWRDDNPAAGVQRFHEGHRERFLDDDEIERLGVVLNTWPDRRIADVIRLLLVTGARRGEVLGMRWQDLKLESGTWTKPSAHTKQNRTHHGLLSADAVSILRKRFIAVDRHAVFVFPGNRPDQPLKEIKKSWQKIREQADLHDVRIHDLRHTFASLLASDGTSLHIIGQLLGHTQVATTARYAHLVQDALYDALANSSRLRKAGSAGALSESDS